MRLVNKACLSPQSWRKPVFLPLLSLLHHEAYVEAASYVGTCFVSAVHRALPSALRAVLYGLPCLQKWHLFQVPACGNYSHQSLQRCV